MIILQNVRRTIEALVVVPGPGHVIERVALLCIIAACLALRLATIGEPPLEQTGWKEIDHLMIAESYREHGVPFWYPSVRWPAEPPRWTEMELPLVPYVTAGLQSAFGVTPLASRAVTLVSFLLLIFYFHRLVRRELGPWVAIVAAVSIAVVPLYSSFGRWVFSEPPMLLAMVAAVFHAAEWLDHRRLRDAVLGCIALSLAISLKIEALWIVFPMTYLLWRSRRSGPIPIRAAVTIFGLALVVPVVWYAWAGYLEATGARAFGLFRGHDKFQTLAMLSDPGWWSELTQRVTGLSGGRRAFTVAAIGAVVGAWLWRPRSTLFVIWAVGAAAYTLIVAEGNLDAPYRQFHLVPAIAFAVACGAISIAALLVAPFKSDRQQPSTRSIVLPVMIAVAIVLAPAIRGPHRVLPATGPAHEAQWQRAQIVRSASRPGDKLVAFGEYDPKKGGNDISPVLFYYSRLQGWNVRDEDCSIEYVRQLIERGATLMAVVPVKKLGGGVRSFPPCVGTPSGSFAEFTSHYKVIYQDEWFLLIDLTEARAPAG